MLYFPPSPYQGRGSRVPPPDAVGGPWSPLRRRVRRHTALGAVAFRATAEAAGTTRASPPRRDFVRLGKERGFDRRRTRPPGRTRRSISRRPREIRMGPSSVEPSQGRPLHRRRSGDRAFMRRSEDRTFMRRSGDRTSLRRSEDRTSLRRSRKNRGKFVAHIENKIRD